MNEIKINAIGNLLNLITVEVQEEVEIPNPDLTREDKKTWKWIEENFVDLGLPSGTLWAKKNLGAETENDAGLLYRPADLIGYDYNTIKKLYKNPIVTVENYQSYYNDTLKKEYDAAYKQNKLFSIPNENNAIELIDFCKNNYDIANNKLILRNKLIINKGSSIEFAFGIEDSYEYSFLLSSIYPDDIDEAIITCFQFNDFGGEYDYFQVALRNTKCANYIRPVITKESLETNLPPKTIKQTVTKTVEMTVKEYIDKKVAEGNKKPSIVFDMQDIIDSISQASSEEHLIEIHPKLNNITIDKILDNIYNIDYMYNRYISTTKISNIINYSQDALDSINIAYNLGLNNAFSLYYETVMDAPVLFTIKNNKIYLISGLM